MSSVLRGLVLGVIVSSLAGCGGAPHKEIDESIRAKITASDAVVAIPQPQLYATFQETEIPYILGAGFLTGGLAVGFMAGVVDSAANGATNEALKDSRTIKAAETLRPVTDASQGFDFDSPALSSVQADLPKVAWLHLGRVTFTKSPAGLALDKAFDTTQVPYILYVLLDYHLSFDFKQLTVTEHFWLSPRPRPGSTLHHGANGYTYIVPGSDPSNAVYENIVTYETAIPEGVIPHQIGSQEKIDDALQYWAKDHAAAVRARLTDAIDELSRLSLQALLNPGKPAKVNDEVAVGTKEGQVLENQDNARYVIQFDDGSLMSIDAPLVKVLRTGKMD